MHGIGIPSTDVVNGHAGYLDRGIGIVASAASAGMTMMGGAGGGLGSQSGMKLGLYVELAEWC